MKKLYSLLIALTLFAVTASAQSNNNNNNGASGGFSQLIQSSPADATKLLQNFAEPLFKGFGIGLNSGWNNTAKTKKFLHFDLRITANAVQVPTSAQTFDVTQIGLSNHLVVDPTSPTKLAPTFGGDKKCCNPFNGCN